MQKIEEWVRNRDRKAYTVVAQQGAEPTLDDVAVFEKQIGFDFPDDFRRYLVHPLGGLVVEVVEDLWPRPKQWEVGPAWSFRFGLYAYSLSPEAPEWVSMQAAWNDMCVDGYPQYLPVLRIASDADRYCLTKKGNLVIWRHETPGEPDSFDGDFFAALAYELAELDARKDRKLQSMKEDQGTTPRQPQ